MVVGQQGRGGGWRGLAGGGRRQEVWRLQAQRVQRVEGELVGQSQAGQGGVGEQRLLLRGES